MGNLRLTMACGPYDRTEALRNGAVQLEGADLTYIPIQWPVEIFSRMLQGNEFDIAEMSLSHCFVLRSQGRFPFITLPVFVSRLFRHGYIFVNRKSGIRSPKDLENRRIGVQGHQMTAAVWIRGILHQDHGVSFGGIQWVEGGVNVPRSSGDAMVLRPSKPLELEFTQEGKTLSSMLAEGEIDALLGALIPDSFKSSPDVVRLFPDYQEVEREYFKRTGIFPIMHALVIRESLYKEHPWVAESICKACEEAKAWAWKQTRFSASLRYMIPWLFKHLEEMDELFGGDPWPYGVEANRQALETFAQYLVDQQFISKRVSVEEIFTS